MNANTTALLFGLLRSAVCGDRLRCEAAEAVSSDALSVVARILREQDLGHLLAVGLYENDLLDAYGSEDIKKELHQAIYRYEQLNYEFSRICETLEEAEIDFLPLKGAVIRRYYPEPWMRTSCDVDILIRTEQMEAAIAALEKALHYREGERATHDVTLLTPQEQHLELHFELVEEGRAGDANAVLADVWQSASQKHGYRHWYEMDGAMFYFYHIAHMAKHFETGGCGIRPLLDLWLLDHIASFDSEACDALLAKGGLLQFAKTARALCRCWMENEPPTDTLLRMQAYLLNGGMYGSSQNRVALQQKRKGGRLGYLLSRIFLPYERLKYYYPILERHRWLTPLMQIRRWFLLFRPDVAKRARQELSVNRQLDPAVAEEMHALLSEIGL